MVPLISPPGVVLFILVTANGAETVPAFNGTWLLVIFAITKLTRDTGSVHQFSETTDSRVDFLILS